MSTRMAFSIVLTAIASLTLTSTGNAEFRVCNKAGAQLDVAIGYENGRQGWISEGWWTLKVGECTVVLSGNLNNRYYYVYAENGDGGEWNGEDSKSGDFCVKDEKFKLYLDRYGKDINEEVCKKHGLVYKNFYEVDVGNYKRWTQTLEPIDDDPLPSPFVPERPRFSPATTSRSRS